THDRDPHIKRRPVSGGRKPADSFRQQMINSFDTLQQLQKFGRAFAENLSSLFFHQRRIANELHRIAETLFGMKENGLAVQGGTVPERFRKRQPGKIFSPPAPFILRPALVEISLE